MKTDLIGESEGELIRMRTKYRHIVIHSKNTVQMKESERPDPAISFFSTRRILLNTHIQIERERTRDGEIMTTERARKKEKRETHSEKVETESSERVQREKVERERER